MQTGKLKQAPDSPPKTKIKDLLTIDCWEVAPAEVGLNAPEGAAIYRVVNTTKVTQYFVAVWQSPDSGKYLTVCDCESRLNCKHRRLALATQYPKHFTY